MDDVAKKGIQIIVKGWAAIIIPLVIPHGNTNPFQVSTLSDLFIPYRYTQGNGMTEYLKASAKDGHKVIKIISQIIDFNISSICYFL